jgi:hypothetical protein
MNDLSRFQNYQFKYGFVNGAGDVVLPAVYDWAGPFNSGFSRVRIGENWFFINHQGAPHFPLYQGIESDFSEGLAPVSIDGRKWGYINTDGKPVIPFLYDSSGPFRNEHAVVKISKNESLINRSGEMVLEPKYQFIQPPSDQRILVVDHNQRCFFLSTEEHGTIGGDYFYAKPFRERLAVAYSDEKLAGYLNTDCEWAILPQLSHAGDFSEGLAPVCTVDGKWFYINRKGQQVLAVDCGYVSSFNNGLARVWGFNQTSGVSYIDKNGVQPFTGTFPGAHDFNSDLAEVSVIREKFPTQLKASINREGKILPDESFLGEPKAEHLTWYQRLISPGTSDSPASNSHKAVDSYELYRSGGNLARRNWYENQ